MSSHKAWGTCKETIHETGQRTQGNLQLAETLTLKLQNDSYMPLQGWGQGEEQQTSKYYFLEEGFLICTLPVTGNDGMKERV